MNNPWERLPSQSPYVLPEDAERVSAFNASASDDTALQLELLPEPFLGNPNAPVVLLNLNPGFDPRDEVYHREPKFIERSRENLRHQKSDYPFFLLDPAITAPGNRWWTRKLGALIREFDLLTVAQRVLCVEYFPYHSRRFGHGKLVLPSQEYSFSLVRRAIEHKATIIIMRSKRIWFEAVPELNGYGRLYQLRNARSPYISPRNCPDGFEHMCLSVSKGAEAGTNG